MTMASNFSFPFLTPETTKQPVEQETKPLFNDKEIEDYQRFASFFSWQATQKNSAFNTQLRETANINSPIFEILPNTSYTPVEEVSTSEQPDTTLEKPKVAKTPTMTREYFKRFGKAENSEERELSNIAESIGLGDVGTLSYSPFSKGKFRLGTLGYHEASVLGASQGSLLELATTNQNTIWAQTNLFMNTDLFRDSPAMKPIIQSKPMFDVNRIYLPSSDGSNLDVPTDAYIKADGSPLLIKDFAEALGVEVPPELIDRQNEVVTPDTIVNYSGESPITASQIMPNVDTVKSPGLGALMRNEFEESFFNYNIGAVNNWERFFRVGDYGSADRSSYGFDLSMIPVMDVFEAYVSPETTNPAWIALHRSHKINGASLVKELKERDPVLYQAWTEEGVNWQVLSEATNAGEFRAHVNGVFVNNAIARAVTTSTIKDPYFTYVRKAREMAYSTLTSGDAVAQSFIMAATMGASAGFSVGLTARSAVAAGRGVQVSRATLLNNLRFARNFQRGLQNVNKFLPINLPGTVLELSATKLGTSLPRLASLHNRIKAGGLLLQGSAWTVGQSVEGFVEEGITDLFNQGYESVYGLRSTYDFGQTFKEAIQGALMEPILGTALMPMNMATSIAINSPTYALVNGARLVGFNGKRIKEFNAYLSTTQGNWEDLSEAEQEIRMQLITRGLLFENTFGSFISGDLNSAEKAHAFLKTLAADLNGMGSNLNPGTIMEAAILFGDRLEQLNNAIKTNKLTSDQVTKLVEAFSNGVLSKDSSGNIKVNSDLAEMFLGFIVIGGEGKNTMQVKQSFLQKSLEKEINKEFETENAQLIKDIENEKNEDKKKELQKTLLELFDEKLNNPNPQILEKLQKLENQQEIFFSLLPGINETIQNNELDDQTISTITVANQSIEELTSSAISRVTEEFNQTFNQIATPDSTSTEPSTTAETTQAPIEAVQTPAEATQAPAEAVPEATQAPTEATQAPTEAVPEATQAPAEVVPEATQAPAEVVPEATQAPAKATQTPATPDPIAELEQDIIYRLNQEGIDSDLYLKNFKKIHGKNYLDALEQLQFVFEIYSGDKLKEELKSLISC